MDAYRTAIMAESIDQSTPGIGETIKHIETIYRGRFNANMARENYDLASIYIENLEKVGVYSPSASAMLEEMSEEFEKVRKFKPRPFNSF